MPNGNGTSGELLKYLLTLLLPLLALAVAWGTIQTRLDNLYHTTTKIEIDIKEMEQVLLNLQLEQREFQAFRQQWLIRWGQFLEGGQND